MIYYDSSGNSFRTLLKFSGSVAPKAVGFALPCGLFGALLCTLRQYSTTYQESIPEESVQVGSFIAFNSILGFLIVFRTQNSYRRYWEGLSLMHKVRGDMLSATSHLFAFCASEEHLKSEVLHTQRLIAKLMSLFYCMALQSVAITDDTNFQIIDTEGLDPAELCYLANAPDPPLVLMHWIQRVVVGSSREHILDISPPVLSRVFHELSNAVVALHDASKISDTPFPFAFAQMIAWMLATQFVMTPLICSSMTDSIFLAGGGSFIAVFLTFSMNLIASEIELPFGSDPNDLPLADMQQTMNVGLMTLMHPQTQTTPTMMRGRLTLRVSMWQDCLTAAEAELPGLRSGCTATLKEGEEEDSSVEYGTRSSGGSSQGVAAMKPARSIWPSAAMTGMASVRSDRSSSTITALPSHSKFAHQQLKMQLRQGKIDHATIPFHIDVPHPSKNGMALVLSSSVEKNEVPQIHLTTDGLGHAVTSTPPLSSEVTTARTQRRCRFSDHDVVAELNDSPRCAEDPTYENPLRVVGKHTSAKVSLGASVLHLRPPDVPYCKKECL